MKLMQLKTIAAAAAIVVTGLAQSAHAANYSFDYTYNGTNTFTNQSAAGSSFTVGDTVTATFNADGAGYWDVSGGRSIWTPLQLNETGTRFGDLSWTLFNNGVLVDSGAALGQSSMYIHIPQPVYIPGAVQFDKLVWTYTLTSSDAPGNTLNTGNFGYGPDLMGGWGGQISYVAAVPEPETYALMLVGLGLVGSIARRRKAA